MDIVTAIRRTYRAALLPRYYANLETPLDFVGCCYRSPKSATKYSETFSSNHDLLRIPANQLAKVVAPHASFIGSSKASFLKML